MDTIYLTVFVTAAIVVAIMFAAFLWYQLDKLKKEQATEQDEPKTTEDLPYKAAKLLTRREYAFFKVLQPIARKYNLMICPKIRLADLVAVPEGTKERKWFNYIKAKHVDFTLCDMDLRVKLVIELDDSTHDQPERQSRDDFVDRVFQKANIKLLHVRQWGTDLEQTIKTALGITEVSSATNEITRP